MKKLLAPLVLLFSLFALPALASNCPTYPFTLTNGQTADANQVMANFNSILNCANITLLGPSSPAGGALAGTFPNPSLAPGAAVTNIGYTPLDAGGSIPATGEIEFAAPTLSNATINLAPGTSPSVPNNGDFWCVTNGCYVYIDGVQIQFANAASTSVTSFNMRTGAITLTSGDVTTALAYTPLRPTNNLSDVTNVTTALSNLGGAPLNSPNLNGTPTAPTAAGSDSSTKIATTAFVHGNFAALASPAFSGVPTAPTATGGTNTTQLATTAFTTTAVTNGTSLATLASTFTQSLGANGYITLPGGLIEQWGTTASVGNGSSGSTTFPKVFTTACYSVVISRVTGATAQGNGDAVTATSTSSFTVSNGFNQTTTYHWIAFGK